MRHVALSAVLMTAALGAFAQDNMQVLTAGQVQVRAMRDVSVVEMVPGAYVRTVVGTTASFSLGDFGPGMATARDH